MDLNIDVNKIYRFRFSLKDRISLYAKLAAYLNASIDIMSSIKAIEDRYRENKDYRANVLADWRSKMNQGVSFGDAISWWIPSSEYMLITAGEKGQGLKTGLEEASVLSKASQESKKVIISSSIMPLVLFFAIILVLIGFKLKMAPIFTNLLPISKWPSNARMLYEGATFLYNYIIVILAFLGILSVVIAVTMGSFTRTIRFKFFDRLPPWSIYRSYQASAFLIGLSSLLKSGISLNDSLLLIHRNASEWTRVHLNQMLAALRRATSNHGKALDTGMLDKETAGDVQDYSRLSSFEDAIMIMGRESIEKGVEKIRNNMNVFKNIMLVLVAICIVSIYGITYSLQMTVVSSISR